MARVPTLQSFGAPILLLLLSFMFLEINARPLGPIEFVGTNHEGKEGSFDQLSQGIKDSGPIDGGLKMPLVGITKEGPSKGGEGNETPPLAKYTSLIGITDRGRAKQWWQRTSNSTTSQIQFIN
ncbi:hypothetical protein FF1_028395 [Malus domestica]